MTSATRELSSDQQALEALEAQEGKVPTEQGKSFAQEANDALAARGLKVVTEVHYQAKLQYLIDLTFVPIPDIKDALFALLAPNASGFEGGDLRDTILYFVDKAANEAKKDLASKDDMDLPVFDFNNLHDRHSCYSLSRIYNYEFGEKKQSSKPLKTQISDRSTWLEGAVYTLQEQDCAPDFSRETMSSSGALAHAPLFYVGKNGLLCNNWNVTTTTYTDQEVTVVHDFVPYDMVSRYECTCYGMGQLFTGRFDRAKLSKASVEVQILYYVWYIAANMVKAGAIMPQLFVSYENRLQCRWIPAILSPEIKTLVTKVGLFLQGYEHLFLHRLKREGPLDPLFLGQLMLSGFIHSYMSWIFLWYGKAKQYSVPEYHVLLGNVGCSLDGKNIEQDALHMRLESWLSPLAMNQLSITPVLRFYDLDDPDSYQGSVFDSLKDEIALSAKQTKQHQKQALAALNETSAHIVDMAKDLIDANYDLDDLEDIEDLTLDQALEQSFGNTVGVGMELGFSGLDPKITSQLYAKGQIDDSGVVSLAMLLSESCCEPIRYECLRTATRLASIAKILGELMKNPHNICVISLDDLFDTIQIALGGLTLLGVKLILPRSLTKLLRPSSTVYLDVDKEDKRDFESGNSGLFDLRSMLRFDWQLAIDNQRLSANEFKVLLSNSGKIVRFHDQFVYADPAALLKIQNHLKKQQVMQANHVALMNAVLTGKLEDNDVRLSPALKKILESLTSIKPLPLPQGLNAELRPYQKRGYDWLMHNIKVQIGSILADDMGLGKTLQVISVLLKLKEDKVINESNQALVIVPTTLIPNWLNELRHFAPALTTSVVHASISNTFAKTDVVITSYGTARSRLKEFKSRNYLMLIVDEAQAIKNRDTAVNKALREIHADYFIAMSGTPVENHLIEYYSILDFANRNMFGTVDGFKRSFANPIEKDHDQGAVNRFKSLTAPFILRRLKTDKTIINDLPDKMSADRLCYLTPNQTALYQAAVNRAMDRLNDGSSRKERSSLVLKLVQDLRAICNSPAQYEKSEDHYSATDSGKVQMLLSLIKEIKDSNGKALIFTQSVIMGNYLVEILSQHTGKAPQFLHGGLKIEDRLNMVNNFQRDPNEDIMLLSLRAAGTGLNLTAANYVIHYDLWWNPAVENQATDRAFRIGQTRNVQVYRLICANTFEEKINELINSKRELAEMTVSTGESWIGDMSNRQLNELFALSQDAATFEPDVMDEDEA